MKLGRRDFLLGSTAIGIFPIFTVGGGSSAPFGKVTLNLANLFVGTAFPFINQAKRQTDLSMIVSGIGYHMNTTVRTVALDSGIC